MTRLLTTTRIHVAAREAKEGTAEGILRRVVNHAAVREAKVEKKVVMSQLTVMMTTVAAREAKAAKVEKKVVMSQLTVMMTAAAMSHHVAAREAKAETSPLSPTPVTTMMILEAVMMTTWAMSHHAAVREAKVEKVVVMSHQFPVMMMTVAAKVEKKGVMVTVMVTREAREAKEAKAVMVTVVT